jgi:hypothetical protein
MIWIVGYVVFAALVLRFNYNAGRLSNGEEQS